MLPPCPPAVSIIANEGLYPVTPRQVSEVSDTQADPSAVVTPRRTETLKSACDHVVDVVKPMLALVTTATAKFTRLGPPSPVGPSYDTKCVAVPGYA